MELTISNVNFPGGPRDPLFWVFLALLIFHGAFLVGYVAVWFSSWLY